MRALLAAAAAAAAAAVSASPCDGSLPGLWRQSSNVLNLTWQGAASAGAFVGAPVTSGNSWQTVDAAFSLPDFSSVVAHFSNKHVGHGNVSAGCTHIAWDDGSVWSYAGKGPAPGTKINVHFAMHTHECVESGRYAPPLETAR